MNPRAISTIFWLTAVLGAGTAAAQQPATVARLTNLEGTVLVSQDNAMVAAAPNQRVAVGTRVLTTAGAKAVVNYDTGCEVTLNENERFTVRVGECPALMSDVVALGAAPGAIGGGVGAAAGSGIGTIIGIPAIGAVGYGAYELFRTRPVSSN